MAITRRSFLRIFGTAAAAAVVDPEVLAWRPGAKTIFLPGLHGINHATFSFWRYRQAASLSGPAAFESLKSIYDQCSLGGVAPNKDIVIVSGETAKLMKAIVDEADRAATLRRWRVRL